MSAHSPFAARLLPVILCTIVEAAQILGTNASTARSRYAAARTNLRSALVVAER